MAAVMRAEYHEQEPGRERLERLSKVGMLAIEADPEYQQGDKIIVALDRDDDTPGAMTGGLGAHGYSGHGELFVALMDHAQSIIEATGKGTVVHERQPDGSFISRIVFNHTGKDIAAQFVAKFLRKFGG